MKLALKLAFKEFYRFLSDKNQRTFWYLAAKYADKARHTEAKVKFMDYSFRVADTESFVWQYKDIFTDELYRFETENREPVIIDCGSNIGMSILYFRQNYPQAKIYAYEAHPKIAKILKQNLAQNKITDINILNKAVWIDNNGISFADEGADGSSIFGSESKLQIPSVRLADELEPFRRIDMLKMDIEGAEIEVLKDAEIQLAKVQNLFVEFHSFYERKQDLQDLLEVLTNAGFRYDIYSVKRLKKSPMLRFNEQKGDMDFQLNIFAKKAL